MLGALKMTRITERRRQRKAVSVAYILWIQKPRGKRIKPWWKKNNADRAGRGREKKFTRPRRKCSVRSNVHTLDLFIITRSVIAHHSCEPRAYHVLVRALANLENQLRFSDRFSIRTFAALKHGDVRERSGLIAKRAGSDAAARISHSFYRLACNAPLLCESFNEVTNRRTKGYWTNATSTTVQRQSSGSCIFFRLPICFYN